MAWALFCVRTAAVAFGNGQLRDGRASLELGRDPSDDAIFAPNCCSGPRSATLALIFAVTIRWHCGFLLVGCAEVVTVFCCARLGFTGFAYVHISTSFLGLCLQRCTARASDRRTYTSDP